MLTRILRNIVYPGSPMTTSFHRNLVNRLHSDRSRLVLDLAEFNLPQLLRKTVSNPDEMVQTDFHHTIYELEGDMGDLSNVQNSDLLDKKVIKRKTEAQLILENRHDNRRRVSEYLSYILELEEQKIKNIIGVFNDKAKAEVE